MFGWFKSKVLTDSFKANPEVGEIRLDVPELERYRQPLVVIAEQGVVSVQRFGKVREVDAVSVWCVTAAKHGGLIKATSTTPLYYTVKASNDWRRVMRNFITTLNLPDTVERLNRLGM